MNKISQLLPATISLALFFVGIAASRGETIKFESLPWLTLEVSECLNRLHGSLFDWQVTTMSRVSPSKPDDSLIEAPGDEPGREIIISNKFVTQQTTHFEMLSADIFKAKIKQKAEGSGPGFIEFYGQTDGRVLRVSEGLKTVTLLGDQQQVLYELLESIPIVNFAIMLSDTSQKVDISTALDGDFQLVKVKGERAEVIASFDPEDRSLRNLKLLVGRELKREWRVIRQRPDGPSWLPEEVVVERFHAGKVTRSATYILKTFSKLNDPKKEDFEYIFKKGYQFRDKTIPGEVVGSTDEFFRGTERAAEK